MAVVRIPDEGRTITEFAEAKAFLATLEPRIDYEMWKPTHPLTKDSTNEEILEAYKPEIEELKKTGGYVTADVINVSPKTENLDAMLAKFAREHRHDEDEVRFCIEGRGVFHIHPDKGPIVSIEVGAGDLIRVPRGTKHWFDLCTEKTIRCIRLFQDMAGWTPLYTDSGVDAGYMPVCMGVNFIPADDEKKRIQEARVV